MCPRLNPYAEYAYDGIQLNPMEVLFVKVKGFLRESGWISTQMATTYSRWISSQVSFIFLFIVQNKNIAHCTYFYHVIGLYLSLSSGVNSFARLNVSIVMAGYLRNSEYKLI